MKLVPSQCAGCPAQQDSQLVQIDADRGQADYVIALAGNPNTGKSTVFNALTGLRQHTGNWPGKTVARAEGTLTFEQKRYRVVDLPGTYSLLATSYDEEIARDFILFGQPDVTVVVVDATRLHRNLNLALQVLEITGQAIVCLNLMDEARRHGLTIDHQQLSRELGVPVVPTSARFGEGLPELLQTIHGVASGQLKAQPVRIESWSPELRGAVERLAEQLRKVFPGLPNAQWVAMRLLDGDERITQAVRSGELVNLLRLRPVTVAEMARDPSSTSDHTPDQREELLDVASSLRWELGPAFHQALVETIFAEAARIADKTVTRTSGDEGPTLDRTLDRILTNRWTGFPVMILLLAGVLWLTIAGANYPSQALAALLLETIHPELKSGASAIGLPWWLSGLLIDGVYLATAWVVSVMLPPMAIFFPLFTLLEDFGYLPRVAFNLDGLFKRAGGQGKQALTMCMGLGCNAAGVIATRVIESPRERLVAIITNNFALCNGRWPTQILLATIFFGVLGPPYLAGFVSAMAVVLVALLGVFLTFVTSWGLSRTVLRGEPSTFHLELPPYRPPRLLQTLYTSLIDRTIFVLWRAVVFAVPAGAAIWLIGNVSIAGQSIAEHAVQWLNPVGILIGLNGVILLAYIVAIPANEIVIPTVLMLTVLTTGVVGVGEGPGVMFEPDPTSADGPDIEVQSGPFPTQSDYGMLEPRERVIAHVLNKGGWTLLTAVNLMLFSLVHNPCSTTIYTIWKETRSVKWTALSALLPLGMGMTICFFVTQFCRLLTG